MIETMPTPNTPRSGEVANFRSATDGDPLLYPGERPEGSYVTDGGFVTELRVSSQDGRLVFTVQGEDGVEMSVDNYLQAHAAAPMDERVPVLAYGADLCPGSLLGKYSKVG